MSDNSKIEWTDATWNPVTGCTKVSEGCRHCYALTFAERWRGTKGHYFENGFDLTLRPNKLDEPLKWKRPRKIFVNSMSDLFHSDINADYVNQVFDVMMNANWHTYQVLTKRPERMRDLAEAYCNEHGLEKLPKHIWLGTSVENQKAADERIPHLIGTPATVKFLSCEPLLGPVDFRKVPGFNRVGLNLYNWWVIVGGESGRGARPMEEEWARSIRDQCKNAGVPFFFKQWGGVNKSETGRELDGRTWDEMPA